MTEVGRLERVDLRSLWGSESGDFTPWLAEPAHLALLGEALGTVLELEAQEQEVGPFRADLLCKDAATDQWVLVENQLERTDHAHLGQLLTYAAGLQAVTIVWVAAKFTEEHRAALDWLNEITDERFAFFGIEIELWRIGSSPVAPKFNLVSKPNDWTKSVQAGAKSVDLTANRQLQVAFWTAFRTYLEEHSYIQSQKPQPQNWLVHTIGRSGFSLCSIASFYDTEREAWEGGEIRVELVINHKDAKAFYAKIEAERNEIEQELGVPVTWHNPAETRQAKVYVRKAADIKNQLDWPAYFAWLKSNLELFHKVFAERVRNLRLG